MLAFSALQLGPYTSLACGHRQLHNQASEGNEDIVVPQLDVEIGKLRTQCVQ
jgi:hypothetical protein